MNKQIISTPEVTDIKSNLSCSTGCEQCEFSDYKLDYFNDHAYPAFKRNKVMTGLIQAMRFYNEADLAAEIPADFNRQCINYLHDLAYNNDVNLECLLIELNNK